MPRIALAALAVGAFALVPSATASPSGSARPSAPATASAATTASAAATASAATCGRHQGHTLVQSASARAYTLNGEVYACAIPNGVVYHLGSASVCVRSQRAGPVAIAGKLVAYGLESCGIDTGSSVVVVRRLTNGKRLRSDPSTTGTIGAESYSTVDSLVVKPNGSDAWIMVENSLGTHKTETEVHAHGTGGAVVLDSGTGIDPQSLRLAGSKLTWRHGRHKRSAKLS
jgi:hypothetical protein